MPCTPHTCELIGVAQSGVNDARVITQLTNSRVSGWSCCLPESMVRQEAGPRNEWYANSRDSEAMSEETSSSICRQSVKSHIS